MDAASANESLPLTPGAPASAPVPRAMRPAFFAGIARGIFSRPLGILCIVGILLGAVVLKPTGMTTESICTLQRTTGYPCPGCGLTRSVTCALHGEPAWAFGYHPLGPVVVLFMALSAAMAILPSAWRERVLARLEKYDRAIGYGFVLFTALLIVYGLLRMGLVALGSPEFQWWRHPGELPPFVRTGN